MNTPLRILIVEDSADDLLLLLRTLRQGGYEPAHRCVQSAAALSAALAEETWDLVLSDYRLPQFNGADALKLVQEAGLDLPFIIVSGVIGEEQAVSVMKAGAHDYVLKDKLTRLVPAITRELRDADVRRLRRQAENELLENREDLNRAQAVAHVGSWRLNVQRNQLLWSDENWRIFGVPKGTPLTYETFLGTIHPDDRTFVHEKWSAALRGEPYDTEHRIVTGAAVKWVRERAELEFDAAGKLLGGFGTTQDITERKENEQALRRAKAEAERASQAKSAFLASVSHELRTPLNAILGFAQVLGNAYFGPLTDKQKEYVDDIYESGKHLLSIINDILDLSKIEAGKMEPFWSNVDVEALLANSLVLVRETCATRGIHLEFIADATLRGLRVTADERWLKQVLHNLLSNASKFTPDGGAITLKARLLDEADPTLEVSVSDTGIGIAPEYQEKIFDAFYQVRNGITSKTPGTGLGLSLVKQLLTLHRGRVWVTSEGEGRGSRFTFVIPVQPNAAEARNPILPLTEVQR